MRAWAGMLFFRFATGKLGACRAALKMKWGISTAIACLDRGRGNRVNYTPLNA